MGGKSRKPNRVKALSHFSAFERFCETHGKAVPSMLAAEYLQITPQGLYNAADRGWIAYLKIGRDRWYSYNDIIRYRWHGSKKFLDTQPKAPYIPGKARFEYDLEKGQDSERGGA